MQTSFRFNPFTGTFDLVNNPSGGDGQVVSARGSILNPTYDLVRTLVYPSGPDSMSTADYSSLATAPARGVILEKPAVGVATVLYYGQLDGFAGFTPGADVFLGPSGTIITAAGLPTATGSIVQKVGSVIAADTILFFFHPPVVL